MITAKLQQKLKDAGFYHGDVDGLWGPMSDDAFDAALAAAGMRQEGRVPTILPIRKDRGPLAWGSKVSALFRERVHWISDQLGIDASDLMACMAWESGETFSPDIRNGAGSGAVGLIQFMPATAQGLGTTVERLATMAPEEQLNYVYKYFQPYKGRLKTLSDLYMAILWPSAVGRQEDYVVFNKNDVKFPKRYLQNRGLDVNGDGVITKAECAAKVKAKLARGLQSEFAWIG